jgi:hypothetical protein
MTMDIGVRARRTNRPATSRYRLPMHMAARSSAPCGYPRQQIIRSPTRLHGSGDVQSDTTATKAPSVTTSRKAIVARKKGPDFMG